MNRTLFFVLLILTITVLSGISYLFYSGALSYTSTDSNSKVNAVRVTQTPTPSSYPETAITEYEEKVVLIKGNVTDADSNFLYSYSYPFPGNYCNGCYGGVPATGQVKITTTSGGYFSPTTERNWLLVQGVFPEGQWLDNESWGIPGGDFYTALYSLEVDQEIMLQGKDRNFTYKRLPDISSPSLQIRVYETNSTAGDTFEKRNIALFSIGETKQYIGFETNSPIYENAFTDIIRSIQLNPMPTTSYQDNLLQLTPVR
jgi:hypothetical protein